MKERCLFTLFSLRRSGETRRAGHRGRSHGFGDVLHVQLSLSRGFLILELLLASHLVLGLSDSSLLFAHRLHLAFALLACLELLQIERQSTLLQVLALARRLTRLTIAAAATARTCKAARVVQQRLAVAHLECGQLAQRIESFLLCVNRLLECLVLLDKLLDLVQSLAEIFVQQVGLLSDKPLLSDGSISSELIDLFLF